MTAAIASFLPAKVRRVIYVVLGAAVGLEAIWDVVPGPYEGKVIASLSVLGFGLAASQVNARG